MASILDVNVSETNYADATQRIQHWAQNGESRAVYATSMHGTMEAHDASEFKEILNRADLITWDGMPRVWMMRLKGSKRQHRTYGSTLVHKVLEMAAREEYEKKYTPERSYPLLADIYEKVIADNK